MKNFRVAIQAKFDSMQAGGKLFRSSITGQEIWDLYLQSMGSDIFRDPSSSEWNCKLCSNWVRRYSNIVSINSNYEIETMFDVDLPTNSEYYNTSKLLANKIKVSTIKDVFFETYAELNSLNYEACKKTNSVFQLGIPSNVKRYTIDEVQKFGVVNVNDIYTFNHFALKVNKDFVDQSGKSVEALMGDYRSSYDVFKRGMETIPLDTLELVRDLINQGSLLNGNTYLPKIETMIKLTKEYNELLKKQKDNWCWFTSYKLPFAKFRNELIGVLCVELSEGLDLTTCVKNWNRREDPTNKCKPTAPITQRQISEAKKLVEELGLESAFNRRMATLDDIKVSEILHSNVGNGEIKKVSIFDNVKSTSTRHKRAEFDNVETVSIDKFMKDILPTCTSIEAFLSNNLEGNMCSLTTAAEESKQIFKYGNIFSKTFTGNIAGVSQIKEAVKLAGGNVEGVLNCRLAWNNPPSGDESDLDLWASEPTGDKIGFSTSYRKDRGGNQRSPMSGQLDVDMTRTNGKMAVENITWTDVNKMRGGVYKFWVNQYFSRNSKGFSAEIEFNGETYLYSYDKPVSGNIQVAEVTYKNGQFSIKHLLPCNESTNSKEIYGLESNKFHKVNLVCLSPNYWYNSNEGHKHVMFMLEGCKSPVSIRGFHNEDLIPELYNHRKVLEVLGTVQMVESTDKQLSGLGFNTTIPSEVILRLKGSFSRVIKVKF